MIKLSDLKYCVGAGQAECSLHEAVQHLVGQVVGRPEPLLIVHVLQHEGVQAPPSFPVPLAAQAEYAAFALCHFEAVVARVARVLVEVENCLGINFLQMLEDFSL